MRLTHTVHRTDRADPMGVETGLVICVTTNHNGTLDRTTMIGDRMALDRKQVSRRSAAARRIVLAKLKDELPEVYRAWMTAAYTALDDDGRRR